jgi:hypothetical protein
MKVSVVVDDQGNIISMREHKAEQPGRSSQVSTRGPHGGKAMSLDVPAELGGKSLVEIHDSVYVDASGSAPALRRKSR